MTEWITVIGLIILGIFLIVAEIIFVPGTTVVGILVLAAMITGFYFGFDYFGAETGWWILTLSMVSSTVILVVTFRQRSWERFALKTTNKSKFNEHLVESLKIGDEGVTVSALRPIGKADFNDKEYEVKSLGNYLNAGIPVKIIRIEQNNIYIEPINV